MKLMTRRWLAGWAAGILVAPFLVVALLGPITAQDGAPVEQLPPADGTRNTGRTQDGKFTGMTKCAACHFPQYKDWKSTPHGNAYNILPGKYKNDAECLACHTTPIRQVDGHVAVAQSAPMGVSCESCHGPGDDHARYALSFVGRDRVFTDEELKILRSKIQRLALDQCIRCHTSKAHKPHPKFDRETPDPSEDKQVRQLPGRGFFDVHGRAAAESSPQP